MPNYPRIKRITPGGRLIYDYTLDFVVQRAIKNGWTDWVQPRPKGYLMKCCDCGLVHELQFRVIKYASGKRAKIQFRGRRVDGLR